MKRRALERHLRQHEAEAIDEGGNHTKWRGPSGGRSVVPHHKEIGPGVVNAICKSWVCQAGQPAPRLRAMCGARRRWEVCLPARGRRARLGAAATVVGSRWTFGGFRHAILAVPSDLARLTWSEVGSLRRATRSPSARPRPSLQTRRAGERGEEITIRRGDTPVVRIVAIETPVVSARSPFGALRGQIAIAEDFDQLGPEWDPYT